MEETGKDRGAAEKVQSATSAIFENKRDAQKEREGGSVTHPMWLRGSVVGTTTHHLDELR